jgi:opacity protein-like surface antigen
MNTFRSAVILALTVGLTTPLLAADFGVRAGRYHESGDEFVGVEGLFDIGAINVNPNVEYSLADDVTSGSANIDVTVDVARFGASTPFVGAGIGLSYFDDEVFAAKTEVLGNLIAGIAFDLDALQPYAQVKYFRMLEEDAGDADELALTIGIRF